MIYPQMEYSLLHASLETLLEVREFVDTLIDAHQTVRNASLPPLRRIETPLLRVSAESNNTPVENPAQPDRT